VDYAVLHCFERASVMPVRRLMEAAWRFALGRSGVTSKAIETALAKDARIIRATENGGVMCTTQEVLEEEKRMVELAKAGKGRMIPLYKNAPPLNLSGQQAAAVEHLLTTANRVTIIRGAAGTGKTTLMKEAVEKIQAAGKTVTVVAPTAQASRGVLKDEGFAAADTVAKLLIDAKTQEALRNQVLWVDEAGLLGTQDMKALLEIATRQNARVVLGGDTRQHASVVRGDALRILNTVAGIRTAEVSKIYRQRDAGYRAAVEDLSKGEVADAFAKLDGMGAIKTIDPMKPNAELVRDYVDALKRGKSALVIAPTHKQGKAVTHEIRQQLRAKGMIGKKEITAVQYVSHNYTEAEKQDTRNYRIGEVVQLNQNRPGFVRGGLWTIAGVTGENILVASDNGEKRKLPLSFASSFDVMVKEEIGLSKGDKIRITRNSFDKDRKRLNNGQMLEVTGVSKTGAVKLRNAAGGTYELDTSFGHLAHAHCITSHASQGKTVDEVFISQPAATFPATDAKQFYVSVSRGRDHVRIYTDDKDALLRSAKEMRDRQSAISICRRAISQRSAKTLVEISNKSFTLEK
jgi:ATP-dependent exoDNAse (exonuclease V) alpha subunit